MMSVFPGSAPHVGVCRGQTVTTQGERVTPCCPESEQLPLGVPGRVLAALPLGDCLSGRLLSQGICARKVLHRAGLPGHQGPARNGRWALGRTEDPPLLGA